MWHHNITCYVWVSYISTTASKGGCLLASINTSCIGHENNCPLMLLATQLKVQQQTTQIAKVICKSGETALSMAVIHEMNFVKFEKIKLLVIIYANFQNPLCHFVDPCTHTICTKFHQNPEKNEQEIIFIKSEKFT